LKTDDPANVPPGTYIFTFKGVVGDKTTTQTNTVYFKNPCTDLPPKLLRKSPFEDYAYSLREPAYIQEWTVAEVAKPSTDLNCGNLVVTFQMKNGDPIDTEIFKDDRTTDPFEFKVKKTDDIEKEGEYDIEYSVHYANYPSNKAVGTNLWEIDIVDPCDNPISITASTLTNQEYTIT
jgi:hypothetical protein